MANDIFFKVSNKESYENKPVVNNLNLVKVDFNVTHGHAISIISAVINIHCINIYIMDWMHQKCSLQAIVSIGNSVVLNSQHF